VPSVPVDPSLPPPAPPSDPLAARVRREVAVFVRLAAPIVGGQVAITGLTFVDTVMAGRLSAIDLAAVAVGASVWAAVSLAVLGVLLAVPPFVAELDGAGRHEEVGPFARQALWLGLALSAVAVALVVSARPLLVAFDVRPEMIPLATGYLRALSWGIPFWVVYLVARFTTEGLGLTRPILYFGLLGLPVDVFANWVLMYGRLGFPRLGAVGCGHATAVVWLAQCVAMLVYLARRRRYRPLGLFARLERPRAATLGEILRVGLPSGGSLFVEVSMFATAALLLASLGPAVVAAHQVAINFAALTFMVPLGISLGIAVRVGHAVGRRDPAAARFSAFVGCGLALACQIVTAVVMVTLPRRIARVYTSETEVVAIAASLLLLAALFQLSDGVQVSAAGALRGLKDTRVPMGIVVVAYWLVGLPLGYLLTFRSGLGARGMWVGMIAGLTVAAVLLAARFLRVSRRAAGGAAPGPGYGM